MRSEPAVETLKPWPSDAVMVVASIAGQENREAMSGVEEAICRDCFAELLVDPRTVEAAIAFPSERDAL